MNNKIFITGGTGYIGSRLISELLRRNFEITALVRKGSESKLPDGCKIIFGDALDRSTYEKYISGCDTFIHLTGVSHPGPGKKEQFKSIDLVSIEQAVKAASEFDIKHFIYLSIAHPAPVMKEYIKVRRQGEKLLVKSKISSTFIRPWYVLGPGHYWPYIILPFYKIAELIPMTKEAAIRLGLVKINHIINCLVYSVINPAADIRIFDVKDIKKFK